MEKKIDVKTLFIIILIILVVALGGFVIYDKVLKKDNNLPVESKQNDNQPIENKKLYHIEDGEEFILYESEKYDDFVSTNKKVSFDYPVIDISQDEIEIINKEIASMYKRAYSVNINNNLSCKNEEGGCLALKKDNKYYESQSYHFLQYKIYESERLLSIIILGQSGDYKAGGNFSYSGWVIDKNTQKVMTSTELTKLFNIDAKTILDEYNLQVASYGYDAAKKIDDILLLVDQNKLLIVVDNHFGNGL